ncbi:hypothetical protein [Lentzea sp. NPDC003310]|uniref:COG1470 family protein n=1 Tax=Lentzea sp. NPDC003310 TaxID=3154447 RepID=UPI0033B974B7
MSTEDGETRNEFSGSAETVLQAGNIGAVHFRGSKSSEDIALMLICDAELELNPGDQVSLTLEVSNLKDQPHDVVLHLNGMPGTSSEVVPDKVTIAPRRTEKVKLVLRTSPTSPEAGRRRVSVHAEDPSGRRLAETSETVTIVSRPNLTASLALPGDLSEPGTYEGVVELTNTGNKPLQGTIQAPGEFGEAPAHHLDLVGSGSFDLAPGDSALLDLELRLSTQAPLTTSWSPQFEISVARGGLDSFTQEVTVTQIGWLAQMPAFLAAAFAAARVRLGEFVSWCGEKPATRRGVLLTVAGVAVVLTSVVTAGLSGEPTTPAGSAAGTTTSSTGPPATSVPAPPYSVMPCAPGTSAINLWGMTEAEAGAHAAWLIEYESRRLQRLPGEDARFVGQLLDLHHPRVQVSRWDDACSPFRGSKRPEAEVFVWFGPLPSDQVESVCAMLHKHEPLDCQTGSTTAR